MPRLLRRSRNSYTGDDVNLATPPPRRRRCAAGARRVRSRRFESKGTSFTIAQRYPSNTFVPGKIRLPISIADKNSLLTTGPAQLSGHVLDSNDKQIATISSPIHSTDLVIPYWAFNVDIADPGAYTIRLDGDDGFGAAFLVSDPAQVTVPYIGSVLPPFDTPTVDNHRGVEPYCTLTPQPCPLHDQTLTQALASGKPVAYMIGTPAHCQTGTCAPALEFLVKSHARLGDAVAMVHADVYSDDAATRSLRLSTPSGWNTSPCCTSARTGSSSIEST